MTRYGITGMSCAACSARIEKVVGKIDGVKVCSVSLLTNSMVVEGDVDSDIIIKAVEDAGFAATLQADLTDRTSPLLKRRLLWSIGFLILLMYVSMGYSMFGFPLPQFIDGNYLVISLIQMALAITIMIINRSFFISGFKAACKLAPNMDTLVSLGATASFMWSFFMTTLIALSTISGMPDQAKSFFHNLYFESTGMILTLITIGKLLEAKSKGRTTDAIKSLMELTPKQARIISKDTGSEQQIMVDITQVKPGDIFIVKSGECIPVDGKIIEGSAAIDESALTGESIPVDKADGDKVYCATIMDSGYIKCEATEVGRDTTLSKIVSLVAEASATKAPIARIADKISGIFVPAVIIVAIITFTIWLLCGQELSFALARAISVLVISCPCALGLATPVAIMVGTGVGARNNILYKTAETLETLGKITTVVLDKTGTITKGLPVVTDVIAFDDTPKDELLEMAYLLEEKSEHPLAKAVVDNYIYKNGESKATADNNIKNNGELKYELSDFAVRAGYGVSGILTKKSKSKKKKEADLLFGGNYKFMEENVLSNIAEDKIKNLKERIDELSKEGKTPLIFATKSKLLGIIAVADAVKDDSKQAIEELKKLEFNVVMLTGDNEKTAVAIAEKVGIDPENVYSDILPDKKAALITSLKEKGPVAMIGDGINDAPALSTADCGIAIGAGAKIAVESADVVLMKDSLFDVVNAIILGENTLMNIEQNLFWAFIYNIICIPLAAGVLHPLFGLTLNPMIAALAMSLSSFCVVSNALRINRFKPLKGDGWDK